MNSEFPRILSLLRKEKALSQKKAAEDLGVTQALLSHYEKGKRECGLDFLVRAADYYRVSADYLLGRSPSSNGAVIIADEIPQAEASGKAVSGADNFTVAVSKKLIISGIDIIFSLLLKIKNTKLTAAITNFLCYAVYSCFRITYCANPKNDRKIFAVKEETALTGALAGMSLAEGQAKTAVAEAGNSEKLPTITTAALEREYGKQSAALLSLVKTSEHNLKKIV